jgi:plasmid maintenance system killer protein
MEIRFASSKMAKLCNSQKEMRGRLGPQCAERLQQRLEELRAAATLEDMRLLPGPRCHELKQGRKGQLAVDLVHPRRLVFEPAHDPVPTKEDGGLDWSQVTEIVVLEVVDYHH